jgi:hypothetical protein
MATRKSQGSLPPVRSGAASSGARAEESPLLMRLLEVRAERARGCGCREARAYLPEPQRSYGALSVLSGRSSR